MVAAGDGERVTYAINPDAIGKIKIDNKAHGAESIIFDCIRSVTLAIVSMQVTLPLNVMVKMDTASQEKVLETLRTSGENETDRQYTKVRELGESYGKKTINRQGQDVHQV
ncbi:predicted protein [Histoplasma capsulatum H143]|uniref:Uncharacterized protein n=1 Tax=Ajellomyces capsulatus (strain H143) TaxID=544712 RepID=C6HRK8_AJECH|nr:predicted protein [Histoplasma capsulatum H143]